eukprot:3123686-Pyramimonas_sp.AAC.2
MDPSRPLFGQVRRVVGERGAHRGRGGGGVRRVHVRVGGVALPKEIPRGGTTANDPYRLVLRWRSALSINIIRP